MHMTGRVGLLMKVSLSNPLPAGDAKSLYFRRSLWASENKKVL